MRFLKDRHWIVFASAIALLAILSWPTATWLQRRDLQLSAGDEPDAYYLVAGARHQYRRLGALKKRLSQNPGIMNLNGAVSRIFLVGNDSEETVWSRPDQKNLSMAELTAMSIGAMVPDAQVMIVPGSIRGTDGEMEALALYLNEHAEIRHVALVTSPFHARRAVGRLFSHLNRPVRVSVLLPRERFVDRAPWTVVAEIAKMTRDRMGLSRSVVFSRESSPLAVAVCDAAIFAAVLILVYGWILYPVILRFFSFCAARIHNRSAGALAPEKTSSAAVCINVLFSAYNEESQVKGRLQNLVEEIEGLETTYGSGIKARIHVGTDGCTDATAGIARTFASDHDCVSVHEFKERRGKPAVLKNLLSLCGTPEDSAGTDLLVLTDANTVFARGSLLRLLSHFADARVGGVCGRLVLTSGDGNTSRPESIYWRWESGLKESESRLDSCLGANGAIYAVRRDLFPVEMPDNTVIDDFVIGMKVREKGSRMVYDRTAIATEELPRGIRTEWKRRVRIGSGDFQALSLCKRCLCPRYGFFAWSFFSHKVIRWITPHLLLLLAVAALARWSAADPFRKPAGFYMIREYMARLTLLAGLLLLFMALLGRMSERSESRLTALPRACLHFLVMQAALFAGFIRFCRGNLAGSWDRTEREVRRAENRDAHR